MVLQAYLQVSAVVADWGPLCLVGGLRMGHPCHHGYSYLPAAWGRKHWDPDRGALPGSAPTGHVSLLYRWSARDHGQTCW